MAVLEYKYPIEAIHGKLADGWGAVKTAKNAKGEQKNVSVRYGKRNMKLHPYSLTETERHSTFGTICSMIATRMKSATQRVTDKQAFAAQSTYKTMRQYLYNVCATQLANQNNQD